MWPKCLVLKYKLAFYYITNIAPLDGMQVRPVATFPHSLSELEQTSVETLLYAVQISKYYFATVVTTLLPLSRGRCVDYQVIY